MAIEILAVVLTVAILIATSIPLGRYMFNVFPGGRPGSTRCSCRSSGWSCG